MTVPTMVAAKYIYQNTAYNMRFRSNLHKILYLANMIHLGRHKEPLVDSNFYATDMGVVNLKLKQVNEVWAGNTWVVPISWAPDIRPGTEKDVIDEVDTELNKKKSDGYLVQLTMTSHGAWNKNYVPSKESFIPLTDILAEYNHLVSSHKGNTE